MFSTYLQYSSITMFITGIATFLGCSILAAPYGKYTNLQVNYWGILLNPKIAWMIMESPNLWISCIVYSYRLSDNIFDNIHNQILLSCFLTHYVNRSIIYPLRMNTSLSAPMPLSVMIAAFIFCVWNGTNQSMSLINVDIYQKTGNMQFIVGIIIFLTGFYINIQSDQILLKQKLNATKLNSKSGTKYIIPAGGMFEYVSCANYFGEIVEWWGFAIACNTFTAVSFAFYTTAYLTSRAIHYHRFYHEKFDEYPKHRKAIFPFLF